MVPSDAMINGTSITVTTQDNNAVVDVRVSAGATWKLYYNAACNAEIEDNLIALSTGPNVAYIKVTAEDKVTTKIYTLTVTRTLPDEDEDDDSTITGDPTIDDNTTVGNPFRDVDEDDWFYDDVLYVYYQGLMIGTSNTLFSPNMYLTRGMIVNILYRMAGSPDVSDLDNPFDDVSEDDWFYNAVIWAVANGIIKGFPDDTFRPDEDISRQDIAVVLDRYADFAGLELSESRDYEEFNDDADISDYARKAIERFFKAEIIHGKPGNKFDPKGFLTRAEAAAMFTRLLEATTEE